MAKSQETYNKKEKEKKRLKKRQEKQEKMEERKANPGSKGFDSMIAYVDENGQITDTPPNPLKKKKVDVDSIEIGVPKRVDEIPTLKSGKVDFFNDAKGFGFIKDSVTGEKYFVHVSSLTSEIKENDSVTFDLERTIKGLSAINVKKV